MQLIPARLIRALCRIACVQIKSCENLLLNMCLTLSVELPMNKSEAERIVSRYNSISLDFHFNGGASFLVRRNPRISISEKGEGCACSMLTDDADWNAPTWDTRKEILPDLALALLFISELASNGYIFEALWAGDKPDKNIEVSLDEILDIVQRNRIGTKTRYIVRAA
jgi:hypothetical protein